MPIVHNESFRDDDPFQLRRFGYDMAGGPEVEVEEGYSPVLPAPVLEVVALINDKISDIYRMRRTPEEQIARFLAYWTPERRARRVAEELAR